MKCQSKKVLITGASSGIGEACARQFAQEGADLLLCARREQRLLDLAQDLKQKHGTQVQLFIADVRDAVKLEKTWAELPPEWRNIDVLVNNAGLSLGMDLIQDADRNDWDVVIDTNLKGLLYITRLVVKEMLARQSGHIINMGSITGYQVYPGGAVYAGVKFALRGITDGIKMDVHGSPIRVTLVNPGLVAGTEFASVRFKGDDGKVDAVYQDTIPLLPEDIADAVVYCATRPPHVDVREILILPTTQTAAHMLYRNPELAKKSGKIFGEPLHD